MAINKRVELTWGEETCSVLVTMAVIERLEEHVNLVKMASDLSKGNTKLSQAARLISMLLDEGGIEASSDEIWEKIFSTKEIGSKDVIDMMTLILSAVFPDPKKKATQSSKAQKK